MDPILNANILLAQTSLLQGLQRSASDFEVATIDLQEAFSTASNKITETKDTTYDNADSKKEVSSSHDSVSIDNVASASSGGASIETAVVNLLQAKNAYLASAKALDIVGDVQDKALDILR